MVSRGGLCRGGGGGGATFFGRAWGVRVRGRG